MRERLPRKMLGDYVGGRDNNFNLLRVFAALLVIFGHSYAIASVRGQRDPTIGIIGYGYSGSLALDIFFLASGYLVTASLINRDDLFTYLKARALRIVPGLAVCLLLTVLVLGPALTSLSLPEYFGHKQTATYFWKNLSLFSVYFNLPGMFEGNPRTEINGSLWTLTYEVRMYIILAVLGIFSLARCRRILLAVVAAALILDFFNPSLIAGSNSFRLGIFFFLGSTIYLFRDSIPLNWKLLAAVFAIAILMHGRAHYHSAYILVVAYTAFWLAYKPNLSWYNRFGDYSYGLYIYAFPVQQSLKHAFPEIWPLPLFSMTVPITWLLAMASWHWVEKPALRLKDYPFRNLLPLALWNRATRKKPA